jgi:hypothetical protein
MAKELHPRERAGVLDVLALRDHRVGDLRPQQPVEPQVQLRLVASEPDRRFTRLVMFER